MVIHNRGKAGDYPQKGGLASTRWIRGKDLAPSKTVTIWGNRRETLGERKGAQKGGP